MASKAGTPDYSIAVVIRTLDLLEAIAESDTPVALTHLAHRIGATKSATYRILANLEGRGYVVKDSATTHYQLGLRLASLGQRALGTFDLRQAARATLEQLHQQFRETVNLGVFEQGEVIYIDMIESDQGLRMAARVGAKDHAHTTALGKAILAFLPDDVLEALLRHPLAARTERSLTDPERLEAELTRIRELGVAEDLGENEPGARCFGAPIFDHSGAVVAAISVSGPESRVDDVRAAAIAAAVRDAAQQITERIGGRTALLMA